MRPEPACLAFRALVVSRYNGHRGPFIILKSLACSMVTNSTKAGSAAEPLRPRGCDRRGRLGNRAGRRRGGERAPRSRSGRASPMWSRASPQTRENARFLPGAKLARRDRAHARHRARELPPPTRSCSPRPPSICAPCCSRFAPRETGNAARRLRQGHRARQRPSRHRGAARDRARRRARRVVRSVVRARCRDRSSHRGDDRRARRDRVAPRAHARPRRLPALCQRRSDRRRARRCGEERLRHRLRHGGGRGPRRKRARRHHVARLRRADAPRRRARRAIRDADGTLRSRRSRADRDQHELAQFRARLMRWGRARRSPPPPARASRSPKVRRPRPRSLRAPSATASSFRSPRPSPTCSRARSMSKARSTGYCRARCGRSERAMAYWLFKTEAETFSWDDQKKRGDKGRALERRAQLPGRRQHEEDEEGRSRLLLSHGR